MVNFLIKKKENYHYFSLILVELKDFKLSNSFYSNLSYLKIRQIQYFEI